jgi:hypothetical protein
VTSRGSTKTRPRGCHMPHAVVIGPEGPLQVVQAKGACGGFWKAEQGTNSPNDWLGLASSSARQTGHWMLRPKRCLSSFQAVMQCMQKSCPQLPAHSIERSRAATEVKKFQSAHTGDAHGPIDVSTASCPHFAFEQPETARVQGTHLQPGPVEAQSILNTYKSLHLASAGLLCCQAIHHKWTLASLHRGGSVWCPWLNL